MPDEFQLSQQTPNAAEHNAKIAAQVAAQDLSGGSLAPEQSQEAFDALDKLRKEVQEDAAKPKDGADEVVDELVEKKEEPAADEGGDKPTDDAAAKPAAEAKPDVAKPKEATPPDDIFSGIELPAKTSQNAKDSFAQVKEKAKQEIAAREAKLAEVQKQLDEAAEKLKSPLPKEIEEELEQLRDFRNKFDVEADPKFKEYDKQVESIHNFVYAQLKKTGKVPDDAIELIKKYGGPEHCNLEKVFKLVDDPSLQRMLESKIADIELIKHNKEAAISETKSKVKEYVAEREKAFSSAATAHNEATKQTLDKLLGGLEWLKDKTDDAKADDAMKKATAEYNKFVKEIKADLQVALTDDSPEMRAILIAGMAQLLHTKRSVKELTAERDGLKTQVAELEKKAARLGGASASRLRQSAAPSVPKNPEPKEEYNKTAGEALDDIRKKKIEEARAQSVS